MRETMKLQAPTLFLTILLLASPALAADPEPTLKKIKRTNTIALGYRESSRPFSFVGDDGKPAGYSVDLCTRVAAAVGPATSRSGSWGNIPNRPYSALETGFRASVPTVRMLPGRAAACARRMSSAPSPRDW